MYERVSNIIEHSGAIHHVRMAVRTNNGSSLAHIDRVITGKGQNATIRITDSSKIVRNLGRLQRYVIA